MWLLLGVNIFPLPMRDSPEELPRVRRAGVERVLADPPLRLALPRSSPRGRSAVRMRSVSPRCSPGSEDERIVLSSPQ